MKAPILCLLAALTASALHGAIAELNVLEGSIESPDGIFVGRDFSIADSFKLEMLYNVPPEQGQWIARTWDDKGRLIVSGYATDQMFRLTIPAVGSDTGIQVEPFTTTPVGVSEGLLYAFGGIYFNVNRSDTLRHGLYKITDTNGDDIYDRTDVIRNLSGSGGHGTHALRLAPDGQSLYLLSGNNTRMTVFQSSRVPLIWAEDVLTMRIDTGFMNSSFGDSTAEAFVSRMDPAGENVELFAMGMRNPVDFDFNKDGELFTYDSDMEWDMGDPWYRPTSVYHITSGADFGFRNGSRKHPQWQFDYMHAVAQIGSGSPVPTTFGTGLRFPGRYQDAFFIGDWSYGNVYAVFMTPKGASYEGSVQPFMSGRPFPVSGFAVNPQDGSLIVMTGGNAQTQVYRVTYTGAESTAPTAPDASRAVDRELRRSLERFHGNPTADSIAEIWPQLSNPDHAIRFAARVALEWQDQALWRERALSETNPRRSIAAIAALARLNGKDIYATTPMTPAPDRALQRRMVAALDRIDFEQLPFQDKLDLLRAYGLTFIRLGQPDPETRARLIAKFDPLLPSNQRELNWELADMLAYLDAPSAPTKLMALLRDAPAAGPWFGYREWANPQLRQRIDRGGLNDDSNQGRTQYDIARQEDEIYYAQLLRVVQNGWTMDLRREYMEWLRTPNTYQGGNNFAGSNITIRADAISQLPEDAREELAEIVEAPMLAPPAMQ